MSGRSLAVFLDMSESSIKRKLAGKTPFTIRELLTACGVLDTDPNVLISAAQQVTS